jgi:hypothetical protein
MNHPNLFVPMPDCYGKYPFCPKNNGMHLDPLKKTEIASCICWRQCRTEYLSKFFDNPSFKIGKISDLE